MEGMRQIDEIHRIEASSRRARRAWSCRSRCRRRCASFKPVELDLLQSALNNAKVQAVLDKSAAEDLETMTRSRRCIDREYLCRRHALRSITLTR